MKISEETVKIELHTIATYDGKEYELEELMNNMFKINAELHSIIKEVREYIENNSLYEEDYDYDYEENLVVGSPSDESARKILLEILDKVGSDKK